MTQSSDRYPGYYELIFATMSSEFDESETYFRDIAPLIPSFQIIESMKNDSIRGSAVIHDSVGLLEEFPIRGEERLTLFLRDAFDEEIRYDMFIYKVDNVRYDNENSTAYYTIPFVSHQRHKAGLRRIIKSYEKPASEIVKDIFYNGSQNQTRAALPFDQNGFPGETVTTQDPDIKKELIVEDTQDIIKCIIPNYTPMQAYRFISDRSMSPKYKSCSYRFFERQDAFYFVTDEYMMEKAVNDDKIFNFTSTAIPRGGEYFAAEMNNFESITSPNKINTVNDITNGSYKAQAIVLDVLYGVVNIKQNKYMFDYNSDNYYVFPEEDRTDKHTQKFIETNITEENCRKFLIVKDYDDKNGGVLPGNKNYPEIVLQRNAFMQQIENVTVSATGHGRFDITCGDVIDLQITQMNSTITKAEFNKHLQGKYLVQDVLRVFDKEIAKNVYTLVKRDWAEANDE